MTSVRDVLAGKYKYVYIYGAGKVSRKLVADFGVLGIYFDGIVVTKLDGTIINGVDILPLADVNTSAEDTAFIISASKQFHEEIIDGLQEAGYHNYIRWDESCLCEMWRMAEYGFVDRRRHVEKCCFILAGYKDFLWEQVFERFAKFIPEDVDVCIISSGVYKEELAQIAGKNSWSYLHTKINSVTLVQNVAFAVFEGYSYVYKVDEDMFVTEKSFDKMFSSLLHTIADERFKPGIVVPLIPVNGYGYGLILDKLQLVKDYEEKFGAIKWGGNPNYEIEKNPETALFMWSQCPQIDILNKLFEESKDTDNDVCICGLRFSIGFILMEYAIWSEMQGFSVSGNADMGTDEEELCAECINKSKAITVCKDTVVGHFAFGKQTSCMREYFANNTRWFQIQ